MTVQPRDPPLSDQMRTTESDIIAGNGEMKVNASCPSELKNLLTTRGFTSLSNWVSVQNVVSEAFIGSDTQVE